MTKVKNPILLVIFNRPNQTAKVFDVIKKVKPDRLYINSDGPRKQFYDEDKILIEKTRNIVKSIDWPCKLKTNFLQDNLGLKKSVARGIDWFFDQEEKGIILEDDCLPHLDFFKYCDEMLDYYNNDKEVFAINGTSFSKYSKENSSASYYFSKYIHVWGWAGWRRSWKYYNYHMSFWPAWKKSSNWIKFMNDPVERLYWKKNFDLSYNKKIQTWDYPWKASIWYNRGKVIMPYKNLVSNIGFGSGSTHTNSYNDPRGHRPTYPLKKINHNKYRSTNKKDESYIFYNYICMKFKRFPYNKLFKLYNFFKKYLFLDKILNLLKI